MIPSETMTWAGPLPPDYADPVADEVATFAGPFETEWLGALAVETVPETLLWAGPLPPASFERARRAQSSAAFSPSRRTAADR